MDENPLRVGETESGEDVDGLSIEVLLAEPAPLLHFFFLVIVYEVKRWVSAGKRSGSCPKYALAVQSYLTSAEAETTDCTGLRGDNVYIFISNIGCDTA